MRYAVTALAVLSSLTCVPLAHAGGGGRTIRADLPCPYGGAGPPNATLWSPTSTSGSGPIPYNPGDVTPFSATLVAGSMITSDDNTLAISAATQYDYYSAALHPAGDCAADPFGLNPNGPLEQVIVYTLAAGNALGLKAGDTEVEFNYNTFFDPSLATTAGTASFTMGGITYASTGGLLPTGTLNDFLFDSSGKYLGALGTDSVGNPLLTPASGTSLAPGGWTSGSSGGGGGGTVTAPELDAASAISALTLAMGGLMLALGTRRSRKLDPA
jgi:hypothetical protein